MSFDANRPASWPNTDVSAVDAEAVDVSAADQTLTRCSRALWVGGAGNVEVTFRGGTKVTITGVAAGTLLPIQVTKIWMANTSATTIQAWF